MLEDLRGHVVGGIEKLGKFKTGAIDEDSCLDENEWFYTDSSFSIPLARRVTGRRRTFAHLSIQVSLIGVGAEVAGEPLLHIFLWLDKVSFDEDYYFAFPIECDESEEMHNVGNRLVTWNGGETGFPFGWAYSVKLFAIKDKEAIKELIVDPISGLLSIDPRQFARDEWENNVVKALPDSLLQKGVLEYRDEWLGI
ncbi:hypothetical protein [Rhodanobacter lindaniclasticus]